MWDFPRTDWPGVLDPWPVFHPVEVNRMAAYAARVASMRWTAAFAGADDPETVDGAAGGLGDPCALDDVDLALAVWDKVLELYVRFTSHANIQ